MQLSFTVDIETSLVTATFPADQLTRVLEALSAPKPEESALRVLKVCSDRDSTVFYDVSFDPATGLWACTCPDFFHRAPKGMAYVCKHILRVQFYSGQQLSMN